VYKKLIEGKKAIFFDLDGTIVDTNFLWLSAVGTVLENLGINWATDENKYEPGKDLSEQWKRLIKRYSIKTDKKPEILVKETNEAFLKLLSGFDLETRDGFWEFLYEIQTEKKLKAVLLTNSHKEVATQILTKINAENSFDLILYGDEVKKPKPDPEIFNKALETLKLKPEEVLVFEDSVDGVEAARLANLGVVVICDETLLPLGFDGYKGKIYMLIPDFSPLPGNLDLAYPE
jgi:HAD superfamily hydrolase (TIGR01509 family)